MFKKNPTLWTLAGDNTCVGMKSPKKLIGVWMEMGVFILRVFVMVWLDWTRLPKPLFYWLVVLLDHSSACIAHFQELD